VPGILNVSFEGVEGESLVTSLTDLALSTGSACNSASEEPSYVLRALGRDTQLAQSSLRFSVGRFTTAADVEFAIESVRREVTRLRGLSPASEPPSAVPVAARAGGSNPPFVASGEAGGPGRETWIRFHLTVADDIVKAARFKAYGCPHTVNVAQWLTDRLPGRRRDEGVPGNPTQWAATLGVPVDRLGRLLVVEDALVACFTNWPTA
jgi:cysteine desulfurase